MEMDYPKTRMDNFFAKAAGSELADNSMEPITDREYWINELAARLAEGGLVPPIEEGDDGKVLTVDEGAAVWAEGGGGSSDPYIGYDLAIKGVPGNDETVWSLEKGSYDIANSKYQEGEPVTALVWLVDSSESSLLTYTSIVSMFMEDDTLTVYITASDLGSITIFLALKSDNSIEHIID